MKKLPDRWKDRHDELAHIARAIRKFRNADTELRRAENSGEQPRLNKAGTRYACAKADLFHLAKSYSI